MRLPRALPILAGVLLLGLVPGLALAANETPAPKDNAAPPAFIQLKPNSHAPVACDAAHVGGAVCVCGNKGTVGAAPFWHYDVSGQPCWPEAKS